MEWTTRLEHTGEIEIHTAWFVPHGWPGKGTTVSLGIPECEMIFTTIGKDGEPLSFVNRPAKNKNVATWLKHVCAEAAANKAALFLNCDTPQQLKRWADKALKLLPDHKRMPLERAYRAEDRRDITQ
jgi:hypothetical protein